MSKAYEGQDPNLIAKQAERDLNSSRDAPSDSAKESGVDQGVQGKFPGAEVKYGSAASGAGNNRDIPLDEGGDINPTTGKPYKAGDFEGVGGPEDKAAMAKENNPGANDVRDNIRQGGETVRPAGSMSNNAQGGTGKSTQ